MGRLTITVEGSVHRIEVDVIPTAVLFTTREDISGSISERVKFQSIIGKLFQSASSFSFDHFKIRFVSLFSRVFKGMKRLSRKHSLLKQIASTTITELHSRKCIEFNDSSDYQEKIVMQKKSNLLQLIFSGSSPAIIHQSEVGSTSASSSDPVLPSIVQQRFELLKNLPLEWVGPHPQIRTVAVAQRILSQLPPIYHGDIDIGALPEDGGIELLWVSKGISCSFYADPDEYYLDFVPEVGSTISEGGSIDSETATKLLDFLCKYWSYDDE